MKKKGLSNWSGLMAIQTFSSFSYTVKNPTVSFAPFMTSLNGLGAPGTTGAGVAGGTVPAGTAPTGAAVGGVGVGAGAGAWATTATDSDSKTLL